MAKVEVELDIYPGFSHDGIYTNVYFGEADTPFEAEVSWEEIIEQEVGYYTVPNPSQPIVVCSSSDGIDEIMRTAARFRSLADELEAKMKLHPIFLRDKWVEATDPETGEGMPASDFYVDYEGYLDYVNGYDTDVKFEGDEI